MELRATLSTLLLMCTTLTGDTRATSCSSATGFLDTLDACPLTSVEDDEDGGLVMATEPCLYCGHGLFEVQVRLFEAYEGKFARADLKLLPKQHAQK